MRPPPENGTSCPPDCCLSTARDMIYPGAMILCLGTTPAAQRVMMFRNLVLDAVNRAQVTLDGAAGKSINVAKVLKALGEEPVATGFLGGPRGNFIQTILQEKGVESDFVTVSAPTRLCITILDESAGTQTELVEEANPVLEPAYHELVLRVQRQIERGCRAVVMSGTIPRGGPVNLYFQCAQMANQAGIITVVDAQGTPLAEALKAKPGLVKPNRAELASTLNRELEDESALRRAMAELHERGAQRVIVTAGREPTWAFDGHGYWKIWPPQIKPVNPIGSGDSFTAGLVWRLLRGDDLGEAARWGSATGAANALTPMPGEVDREAVEALAKEVRVEKQ
jgi:tagatose 6-phosphate kinase